MTEYFCSKLKFGQFIAYKLYTKNSQLEGYNYLSLNILEFEEDEHRSLI
jgi:hypothetical protein